VTFLSVIYTCLAAAAAVAVAAGITSSFITGWSLSLQTCIGSVGTKSFYLKH
jgi:hypothetical protein